MSVIEAERAMSNAERLEYYDALMRQLVPCWQLEFARSTAQMRKVQSAASDPKGSLRDLAAFILAARASEINQDRLLKAEKIARQAHPMSRSAFGT